MGDTGDKLRDDSLRNKAFLQVSADECPLRLKPPRGSQRRSGNPTHGVPESSIRRPNQSTGLSDSFSRSAMELQGGPALFKFLKCGFKTQTSNPARRRSQRQQSSRFERKGLRGNRPNRPVAPGNGYPSIREVKTRKVRTVEQWGNLKK